MIADRIKSLREHQNKTQSELAKQLGITRSSVNAWEIGISVPSTQYVVELAHIFKVSTDYLLGVDTTSSISVAGLTEKDVEIINTLILHLKMALSIKVCKFFKKLDNWCFCPPLEWSVAERKRRTKTASD